MGRRILLILLSAALLVSLAGCTLLEKPESKEADKAQLGECHSADKGGSGSGRVRLAV